MQFENVEITISTISQNLDVIDIMGVCDIELDSDFKVTITNLSISGDCEDYLSEGSISVLRPAILFSLHKVLEGYDLDEYQLNQLH